MVIKRLAIAVFIIAFAAAGHAYAALSGGRPLGGEIASQLMKSLPWDESNVDVTGISISRLEESMDYDDVRVRVPAGMARVGKVTFPVSFFKNGVETKTLWGIAHIKVYRQAMVALKPLKANSMIKDSDVKLSRVDVRDTQDALFSADEAVGKIAIRPIGAGTVIKKDYIKPETLVKRGDTVVVRAETGSISIKSKGTAVENGYRGRSINVKTASGREITGVVVGPGEIAVRF